MKHEIMYKKLLLLFRTKCLFARKNKAK